MWIPWRTLVQHVYRGKVPHFLGLPLLLDFIAEGASTNRLEKKLILKIRFKKSGKILFSSDYISHSQLSLRSLDKVRELDFVPASSWMKGKGQLSDFIKKQAQARSATLKDIS